jgi:hypothetical protein
MMLTRARTVKMQVLSKRRVTPWRGEDMSMRSRNPGITASVTCNRRLTNRGRTRGTEEPPDGPGRGIARGFKSRSRRFGCCGGGCENWDGVNGLLFSSGRESFNVEVVKMGDEEIDKFSRSSCEILGEDEERK